MAAGPGHAAVRDTRIRCRAAAAAITTPCDMFFHLFSNGFTLYVRLLLHLHQRALAGESACAAAMSPATIRGVVFDSTPAWGPRPAVIPPPAIVKLVATQAVAAVPPSLRVVQLKHCLCRSNPCFRPNQHLDATWIYHTVHRSLNWAPMERPMIGVFRLLIMHGMQPLSAKTERKDNQCIS